MSPAKEAWVCPGVEASMSVNTGSRTNHTEYGGRKILYLRFYRRLAAIMLVLALIASTCVPAISLAQDASTPVAETAEAGTESAPPPATVTAPSPTESPVEITSTAEPTSTPPRNTDSIAPLPQPLIVQPGSPLEISIDYQITTPRPETGLHFEMRTAADAEADGWVLEVGGSGGFGALDLVEQQIEPGALSILLRITAPEDAVDGETFTLLASSVVHTETGEFETGVAPETAIATVIVARPNPEPVASPESGEPSDSASPETPVAGTVEPVDATPVPASPQPEFSASPEPQVSTATATVSLEAPIDLSSELALIGRKPHDTVAIGESRAVTLDYTYTAGFARAGTTISAQVVNWDGTPLSGWSVGLNGTSNSFHDAEHLDAGSSFDLTVTVTIDATVGPNAKARLLFTISVDPLTTVEAPSEFTFASASVEAVQTDAALSETFEGPMLRLDGGFSTASVTAPNNGLTCYDPAASYPGGVPADSMIPGQVAQFRCDLTLAGLALLPSFSGTATIQGTNTAGWQIAASSQVSLIGESLLAPIGTYSTTSVSMSGLGVLSLTALLGAGGFSFSIYVKAPSLPLSLSPVNSVTIAVATTCSTALTNCLGSLTGSRNASATLTATVRDIKTTTYGGGALTDLGLLGSLGSSIGNGLVFRLSCDTPATGTQVAPQEIVTIPCHIASLINLSLLGSVASISADVSIAFTDPSSSWKLAYNGTPVSGVINVPLATVLNAGVLSASADFTMTLEYDPGSCVATPFSGQPLNAVNVTAKYHLALASLAEVGISDGWASVPVQLEGASSSPAGYTPLLSATGISFGTYRFSGAAASYTRVSGGQPALTVTLSPNGGANCSAQPWYVTAQFSALAGYQNSSLQTPLGTMISASQISFSGGASNSNANTTAYTPAIGGSVGTIIQSTNTLLTPVVVAFPMALAPPPSQPVGYYLGTVTLTVVSGTPP